MSHTILLIQATGKAATRTYSDYESVNLAMEGVCRIFEAHLKDVFPTRAHINYSIDDLNNYIDALADLTCLVFNQSTAAYVPHDKDWIKRQVFRVLKAAAQ